MPGRYSSTLKITSAGGCVDSFKKIINVVGPYGELNYDVTRGCLPLPVSFKTKTFGATDLTWDFGNGVTTNNRDSVLTYSYAKPGSYIPSALIKDPSGCSITVFGKDMVRVDDFKAGFMADKVVFCDSGTVRFTDSTGGTPQGISYAWSFGDGQQSTESSPSHFYINPGKYTVSLTQALVGGCSKTKTYTNMINVSATPVLSINAQADLCSVNKVKFSSNVKDSAAVKTWQWTFGNGERSANPVPPDQTFSSPGTYLNALTIINTEGCTTSASKTVDVGAKREIIALTDTTICRNAGFTIRAESLTIYTWQPANSLSCSTCANPVALPAADTWYRVTGTQAQTGCIKSDSILLKVVQPYALTTSGNVVLCEKNNVQLQAFGAPFYQWSPSTGLNNAFIAKPVANITGTTQYQVIGYDSAACFNDTAKVSIRLAERPTVELGQDAVISVGNSYIFKPVVSPDVVSYLWSPLSGLDCSTCPNPVLKVKGNMTFTLKVNNADGCSSLDNINIIVTCDQSTVFIPNTFSPNEDGMNDYFFPRGKGIYSINYFVIFNRWGQKVFEKKNVALNDQNNGWDGKLNGKKAESGAYTYLIEVVCDNNQSLKYSGNINLIQ